MIQEHIYKPLPPFLTIKPSNIHGLGLHATQFIEANTLLGVSHVSVLNWVRKYKIKAPENYDYHPTYKVLTHQELMEYMSNANHIKNQGMMITELGDKYMMIKWERFRQEVAPGRTS